MCRIDLPADLRPLPKGKVGALAGPVETDRAVLAACVHHTDHVIIGCCDVCRCIVCDECRAPGNKHDNHPVIDAAEGAAKYSPNTLLPLVDVLRNRVPAIDAAVAALDAMHGALQTRLFTLNNDLTASFFEATQLRPAATAELETRRDQLANEMRAEVEKDCKSVTQQVRSLKFSRDQAFTATRQVDSMVRNTARSHPYEELRLYSLVYERIKYVTPLEPDFNAWNRDTLRYRFPTDHDQILSSAPETLGELYREGGPSSSS